MGLSNPMYMESLKYWIFRCKVSHPGEWDSRTEYALHAGWHCHAFYWGRQVLSPYFDWQKSAIHPAKKILIHLREIQPIIRSRWTPNIQKPGWLCDLVWKFFGGLLYIRLNVSGSLFYLHRFYILTGWQSNALQIASNVLKRIAFAFPVFKMERLDNVKSTLSESSFSEIFRFAIMTSKFTMIGID